MIVLVINCGSSSVKYKLYDVVKDKFLAEGVVEKIGEKKAQEIRRVLGEGYTRE